MVDISTEFIKKYISKEIKICTLGSHSAFQIIKGAKDEGFKTVLITTPDRVSIYNAFPLARPDIFIEVKSYKDILKKEIQDKLIKENVILIPHGSFVEYVGAKNIEEKLYVPIFGNKKVLTWESDRNKERFWLEKTAGIKMPKEYAVEDIDKKCIVKLNGAKGGKGFFIINSPEEFYKLVNKDTSVTIQEYISGKKYYFSFFYSKIASKQDPGIDVGEGKLELIGIDRRDEVGTVVVGNQDLVLRESLLPKIFEIAKKVVESSIKLFYPGIIGPFCLETIIDENLNIFVFEISARIVAGTNLFIGGSPYSKLSYLDEMSMGRRIAREIKIAKTNKKLKEILT